MRIRLGRLGAAAAGLAACACAQLGMSDDTADEALVLRPAHEIAGAIAAGETTSEAVTRAYLNRIARLDRAGPRLQSVLSVNPDALDAARALDAGLAAGEAPGPLHGVPVLIKDNIETADPMPTTAGSLALKGNVTGRDAPLVAGLREAGAVILGKANLSEWANFRSESSISGWSGLGGQTRNPHMLDRSPCGSSAGSGAAIAAGLAAAAVGTETNGSIICPAAMNGVVGFKPTVGLVAQDLIIPISASQDTAGPMTRTVRDAALLLTAMSGGKADYAAALDEDALAGARIGVLRFAQGSDPRIRALFDAALAELEAAGAALVEIEDWAAYDRFWPDSFKVLKTEFKAGLDAYLAETPGAVETRSLDDVIAFNTANAARELALFNQDILDMSASEKGLDDPAYVSAREKVRRATREEGVDKLLSDHGATLLVAPSEDFAFPVDAVHGDRFPGGAGAGWIAAVAGCPHLTVPMGTANALPAGISFMGPRGADAEVLAAGYAYEQRTDLIVAPRFLKTAESLDDIAAAMRPAQ